MKSLGRQLDPELDLWNTAKPFLEQWMREQVGFAGLVANLKKEAPRFVQLLPQLPRLLHHALEHRTGADQRLVQQLLDAQNAHRSLRRSVLQVGVGILLGIVMSQVWLHWRP